MAIKIIVSDTVGFKVKGSINDAQGDAQPFDFKLTCVRLDTETLSTKIKSDGSITDFLVDVVRDWADVKDDDGKQIPFSVDALRQLCAIPGVATVAFRTYTTQVGAKEKN